VLNAAATDTVYEYICTPYTGGIERLSARKNLGKILKVSYFHLGFSPGKT